MAIEIQTELKPNYALVHCRGTFEADGMLEVWEHAFHFAASEGRKAVLIDIRDLTGEPFTTMDRYRSGMRVAELQREPGRRIAIAVVGNEPMIDPRRFAETVARNRGAIGRVFTDIHEAVDWIEKKCVTRGAS